WQDFTSSAALLRTALERLRPVPFRGLPAAGDPMPSTLLFDAVYETAGGKVENAAGRKVRVVSSDGLDHGSRIRLDAATRQVQAMNTVVYGICYATPQGGSFGCDYLKNLSEPTGGRMFQAGKKTSLSQIFQTIQEEMRSQYALG